MICNILAVAPLEFGNNGSGEITQILMVSPKDFFGQSCTRNNGYFYESDSLSCYFSGNKNQNSELLDRSQLQRTILYKRRNGKGHGLIIMPFII